MTTPATTARAIVALGLGKYKTVACAYDPATAQARFDRRAPDNCGEP